MIPLVRVSTGLVFVLALMLSLGCASTRKAPLNPALRQELLAMQRADQRLRWGLTPTNSQAELAELATLDQRHTARMRTIIQEHGWPGYSMVGQDGAGSAWLLVQHADADAEFQARCLLLMEAAVTQGEASRKDYAYLVDRVRTNAGRPQLYGTQFRRNGAGALEPYPIENPAGVDERRRSVGLGPLSDYERGLRKTFR